MLLPPIFRAIPQFCYSGGNYGFDTRIKILTGCTGVFHLPYPSITEDDLLFDQNHIWHPYTAVQSTKTPIFPVESASGVRIRLRDGRELIDGMSSWWSAIHGYNHPLLNAAAHEQIDIMSHMMFGGLTHKPAIELCRRLVEITPEPLQTVFLADSGSVSVEVSIKMAVQYWRCRGDERRKKLLTIRHGYHGDTIGAMSVCDPVNGMHTLFRGILLEQVFVDAPACGFDDPLGRAPLSTSSAQTPWKSDTHDFGRGDSGADCAGCWRHAFLFAPLFASGQ